MPNRVAAHIAAMRPRVAGLAPAVREKLDRDMAVSFAEHAAFQNQQAQAHAAGLLTPDEAQIVYMALGEVGSSKNGGWAAGTDTATKVVVTQLMSELLSRRHAAGGRRRSRGGIELERIRQRAFGLGMADATARRAPVQDPDWDPATQRLYADGYALVNAGREVPIGAARRRHGLLRAASRRARRAGVR